MNILSTIKERFSNVYVLDKFGVDGAADDDNDNMGLDLIFDWLADNFPEINFDNDVFYGASKLVINFHGEENFVIKIPFNGEYWGKIDEESGEYDFLSYWDFFRCAPARNAKDCWNYCNTEVEKFIEIKEMDLTNFFAETKLLCYSKNNYPIYIQEKVSSVWDEENNTTRKKTISQKSLNRAKEIVLESTCCIQDKEWIASAIDYYGEELTIKFLDYIFHDEIIGQDLHRGNYGYRVSDDSPCILDYAGWFN